MSGPPRARTFKAVVPWRPQSDKVYDDECAQRSIIEEEWKAAWEQVLTGSDGALAAAAAMIQRAASLGMPTAKSQRMLDRELSKASIERKHSEQQAARQLHQPRLERELADRLEEAERAAAAANNPDHLDLSALARVERVVADAKPVVDEAMGIGMRDAERVSWRLQSITHAVRLQHKREMIFQDLAAKMQATLERAASDAVSSSDAVSMGSLLMRQACPCVVIEAESAAEKTAGGKDRLAQLKKTVVRTALTAALQKAEASEKEWQWHEKLTASPEVPARGCNLYGVPFVRRGVDHARTLASHWEGIQQTKETARAAIELAVQVGIDTDDADSRLARILNRRDALKPLLEATSLTELQKALPGARARFDLATYNSVISRFLKERLCMVLDQSDRVELEKAVGLAAELAGAVGLSVEKVAEASARLGKLELAQAAEELARRPDQEGTPLWRLDAATLATECAMADTTLTLLGKTYHLHKHVLAKASKFLQTRLAGEGASYMVQGAIDGDEVFKDLVRYDLSLTLAFESALDIMYDPSLISAVIRTNLSRSTREWEVEVLVLWAVLKMLDLRMPSNSEVFPMLARHLEVLLPAQDPRTIGTTAITALRMLPVVQALGLDELLDALCRKLNLQPGEDLQIHINGLYLAACATSDEYYSEFRDMLPDRNALDACFKRRDLRARHAQLAALRQLLDTHDESRPSSSDTPSGSTTAALEPPSKRPRRDAGLVPLCDDLA